MAEAGVVHDSAMRARRTVAEAESAEEHDRFVRERALVDVNSKGDTAGTSTATAATATAAGSGSGEAVLVEATPQFVLQMRKEVMFGSIDNNKDKQ